MEFQKIDATFRTLTGKGPARRMRREGLAPAVVYGKGIDTIAITLSPTQLIAALAGPLRINTPLDIIIKGGGKDVPKQVLAIVADHQYHPLTRDLLHVDFVALKEDEHIDIQVPLNVLGRSLGEQIGGVLMQVFRQIPIKCLPANIPAELTVDISKMEIGDVVSVKDLTLPENTVCSLDLEQSLISVAAPKKVVDETAEGAEGEEGVEGAEAAEGEKKADEGEKKE